MISPKSAIVLDDNRLNLDVLVTMLEHEGVSVRAVQSPRLLAALLEESLPSVIFLDLELPNDDGIQVLHELRHNPRLDAIPIIACTVHTSEIDVVRKAGFNGFLGKPLNAQRFPQQLAKILAGESVWEV